MRRRLLPLIALLLLVGIASVPTSADAMPRLQIANRAATPATSQIQAPSAASSTAGTYVPINLTRVFDTRFGRPLAGGAIARFRVTGHGALPANGVEAVTANVTVLTPASTGSVSVFPGGSAWNGTPTLSFMAGVSLQNEEVAQLGADGTLSIRNNIRLPIQFVVDVVGYYLGSTPTAPGAYQPIAMQRVFDTRAKGNRLLGAMGTVAIGIGGHGAIPADAAGVAVNFSLIKPKYAGSIEVSPPDRSSFTNIVVYTQEIGDQSELLLPLSHGQLTIRNAAAAPVNLVADVFGYYLGGATHEAGTFAGMAAPARIRYEPSETAGDLQPGQTTVIPVVGTHLSSFPASPSTPALGVSAVAVSVEIDSWRAAGSISVFAGHAAWNGTPSIGWANGFYQRRAVVVPVGSDGTINIRNNSRVPIPLTVEVDAYFTTAPNPFQISQSYAVDPYHGAPTAVSCPTTTFCLALQSHGYFATWNGSMWTARGRVSDADDLQHVSCTSPTFCLAPGNGVDYRFDGQQWITSPAPGLTATMRVSCATSTMCLAVNITLYVFNGSSWTDYPVSSQLGLDSASCPTATFCVVGGWQSVRIFQNGVLASQSAEQIWATDVSCPSVTFCAVTGAFGSMATMVDGVWRARTVSTDTAFEDVSCVAGQNYCLATDDKYWITFDGNTWGKAQPWQPDLAGASSVSCASSTVCMATTDASYNASRWDGSGWTTQPVDVAQGIYSAMSCPTTNYCLGVDASGNYFRFQDGAWTSPERVGPNVTGLQAVSCVSATECLAVAVDGELEVWDAATWVAEPEPGITFSAVSCESSGFCAAVANGTVATRSAGGWAVVATASAMQAVSCSSADFCLAYGQTDSYRWDGITWTRIPMPTAPASDRFSVHCLSASACVAIETHAVLVFDGGGWQVSPTPASADLGQVHCVGINDCLISTSVGIAQWNGSNLSQPQNVPWFKGNPAVVDCRSSISCVAAGGDLVYELGLA